MSSKQVAKANGYRGRQILSWGWLWGLCICGPLWAQTPADRPPSPSLQTLQVELRGLSKIVLQLRRDVVNIRKQHKASIKKLQRQHARALQRLREKTTNGEASDTRAREDDSLATLQRRIKRLSQEVATLRQQVKRNQADTTSKGHADAPPSIVRSRLRNPPTDKYLIVTAHEYANGFAMLTFSTGQEVVELQYKLAHMKSFRSTGYLHVRNPVTGKPYPKMSVMTRQLKRGLHRVQVRILYRSGKWGRILTRKFKIVPKNQSDANLFMRYQWANPILRQVRYRHTKGRLSFHFYWASNQRLFQRVSYSFGKPSLRHTLIHQGAFRKGRIVKRIMHPGSYVLYARFWLANGKKGPLLRYKIASKSDGRWYKAHPDL